MQEELDTGFIKPNYLLFSYSLFLYLANEFISNTKNNTIHEKTINYFVVLNHNIIHLCIELLDQSKSDWIFGRRRESSSVGKQGKLISDRISIN